MITTSNFTFVAQLFVPFNLVKKKKSSHLLIPKWLSGGWEEHWPLGVGWWRHCSGEIGLMTSPGEMGEGEDQWPQLWRHQSRDRSDEADSSACYLFLVVCNFRPFSLQQIDRKFIVMLLQSHGFLEYIEAILLDERPSLNNNFIFSFIYIFLPKVGRKTVEQLKVVGSNPARLLRLLSCPTFCFKSRNVLRQAIKIFYSWCESWEKWFLSCAANQAQKQIGNIYFLLWVGRVFIIQASETPVTRARTEFY